MTEKELEQLYENRPEKRTLLNQYGTFILTHEELLQVMSTVALDKKDSCRPVAIKLLSDYHEKRADPNMAAKHGFDGFIFTIEQPKIEVDEVVDENKSDQTPS